MSGVVANVPGAAGRAVRVARRRSTGRHRFVRRALVGFSTAWVSLVIIVALIVQWLPLRSDVIQVGAPNMGPSLSREFFGTDQLGRSTLSRLAYGARVSLGVSLSATLIAMIVGGLLGLLSAYFGRSVRLIVDIITNVVLAVPALVLLLALVLALTPSIKSLIIALSLVFTPPFLRLTRSQARAQLTRGYVTAARALGATSLRVMFREVLPNVLLPIVVYAALVLPTMIVTEGALSFLGYGVPSPTPSWGQMIALGQTEIATAPWPVLIPSIALVIQVFSLNTLADWLRTRFDVRDAQI